MVVPAGQYAMFAKPIEEKFLNCAEFYNRKLNTPVPAFASFKKL